MWIWFQARPSTCIAEHPKNRTERKSFAIKELCSLDGSFEDRKSVLRSLQIRGGVYSQQPTGTREMASSYHKILSLNVCQNVFRIGS
jgi:hypothetical protein